MASSPEVDIDGVEYNQQGKAPRDTIDDDKLPASEELVDDSAEEEKMDERPVKRLVPSRLFVVGTHTR
jgi:hypothetical protein